MSNIEFFLQRPRPDAAGACAGPVARDPVTGRYWPGRFRRIASPPCSPARAGVQFFSPEGFCPVRLDPRFREDDKRAPERGALSSFAKAQLRDQFGVALAVGLPKIIEKRAALVDEHQQAAPAVIVLGVRLEMLGQIGDPLGKDRDLHLGRTGIGLAPGIVVDDFLLALGGHRHRQTPSSFRLKPRTTRSSPSPSSTRATGTEASVARWSPGCAAIPINLRP